jgi:hypothetical protein
METRAKDLRDFTMWNSTSPSIKFLDFGNTILSKGLFFFRNLAVSSSQIHGKGLSKFNDKFAVPFFDNQVGKDLSTDIKQSMSSDSPFIAISFKEMISRFFFRRRTRSFERFLKPVKQADVSVGDFKNGSIVSIFISITRFVFKLAGMKTAFSVNNSSEICQMKRIMDFGFIKNAMLMVNVIELHILPRVTGSLDSIHMGVI